MKNLITKIALTLIKTGCTLLNSTDGWRYTLKAGGQEYILKKYQPAHSRKRRGRWTPTWADRKYSADRFSTDEYAVTLSDINQDTIEL